MGWMFFHEDIVLPSVYLQSSSTSQEKFKYIYVIGNWLFEFWLITLSRLHLFHTHTSLLFRYFLYCSYYSASSTEEFSKLFAHQSHFRQRRRKFMFTCAMFTQTRSNFWQKWDNLWEFDIVSERKRVNEKCLYTKKNFSFFRTQNDLMMVFQSSKDLKTDGVILWGSSFDLNTR